MLERIKLDLRISHSSLDKDIKDNIAACIRDLDRIGINMTEEEKTDPFAVEEPLKVKAIKLYCRWQYNYENQADRYMAAYKSLRNMMSLCGDYGDSDV